MLWIPNACAVRSCCRVCTTDKLPASGRPTSTNFWRMSGLTAAYERGGDIKGQISECFFFVLCWNKCSNDLQSPMMVPVWSTVAQFAARFRNAIVIDHQAPPQIPQARDRVCEDWKRNRPTEAWEIAIVRGPERFDSGDRCSVRSILGCWWFDHLDQERISSQTIN